MEVNEPKAIYLRTGNDIESEVELKNLRTVFNFTKARIAESLVLELFTAEGYIVHKNGFENTYQGIHRKLVGNNEPTTINMRKSPDLVVFDPSTDVTNYIEVKFRFSDFYKPKQSDIEHIFPGCFYIILTPKNFYIIKQEELANKIVFTSSENLLLERSKHFNLRKDTIKKFEEMAGFFFSDHLQSGNLRYADKHSNK